MDGIALVTGAGSGIGRDVGLAFAYEGALGVVFADINIAAAEAAAQESRHKATNPGFRALSVEVDVTDSKSVDDMIAAVRTAFDRIDYSVNSAGIGVQQPAPVDECSMPEFERFLNVNVKGVMMCVRAVSRVMRSQEPKTVVGRNGPRPGSRGSIVNLASANSYVAMPAMVQYVSAKHAIIGLTKTSGTMDIRQRDKMAIALIMIAAVDMAPHGVRVNAVCPSWVDTPMVTQAFATMPGFLESLTKMIPAGRIATQEEVSDVVLFLSSSKASYITGVGWLVDGGTTLTMKVT